MGIADDKLVQALIEHDEELRQYVEEHKKYEQQLAKLQKRRYLTPEEEAEKKRLQKMKLRVKDKIEQILNQYRKHER